MGSNKMPGLGTGQTGPQVGLYASLLPLAVYALLGSSRYLSVGPSALLSLLIVTHVAALAEPGSPRYLAFAMATAFIAGVMQIAMGAARLGVLTNFPSQPVLSLAAKSGRR